MQANDTYHNVSYTEYMKSSVLLKYLEKYLMKNNFIIVF